MNKYEPNHDDTPEEEAFITWQVEQYSDAGTLAGTCPPEEATDKTGYRTGAEEGLDAFFAEIEAAARADRLRALAVLGEGRVAL